MSIENQLPLVSNSKLSQFKDWLDGKDEQEKNPDRFNIGNLFDAIITAPHKLDLFNMTYTDYDNSFKFTESDYSRIIAMKKSYDHVSNKYFGSLINLALYQKKYINKYDLTDEISFSLKSIYDIVLGEKIGIDIKTTKQKKLNNFISACLFLDYDRARYLYTQSSGIQRDFIIGVCTEYPYPIHFIDCIKLGWMESGKKKMDSLLLDYYYYFC